MMGDAHQVPRPAVRDIARQCDAVARACWDQMDRKWARGNRKTVILDTPNIHCRGLADLGRDVLESLCAAPEQLEALKPVPPLRFAGRTITILTRRHAAHRHAAPDQSWARRSWEIGHALERRLIAAPVPVFMLEHRRPAGVTEYLALANEPGWQSLADLLAESPRPRCPADDPPHRVFSRSGLASNPFGPASPETQCRASLSSSDFDDLGRRVVDLLRRFHELGFAHDALTLAAFDVRKLQGRWQVRFATLDAIRQIGRQKPQPLGDDLRSLVADVPHRTIIGRSLWLRWLLRLLPDAQRPAWKAAWKQLTVSPLSRAA
jgi:hypothetical protein